jgi:RNA polymerase sigma factor (sigma-70 family)
MVVAHGASDMTTGQTGGAVEYLRRAALLAHGGDFTDAQLLDEFILRRDEAAFEALLRRHGPMVLGVCRRVLHHTPDAEDAFQATFLVLVRKAATIIPRQMVGNWLYGVAYRTSLEARAAGTRRRANEKRAADMSMRESADELVRRELRAVLDCELDRLPDRYRAAIVLCDLEGKTHKEAARQLGWPQGTLSSRLVRGRAMLAKRLTRHGLAPAGGALALSQSAAPAAVPVALQTATLRAMTAMASGQAAMVAVTPARVVSLTEGVAKAMLLTRFKHVAVVLLALVLAGTGAGLLGRRATARQDDPRPASPPASIAAPTDTQAAPDDDPRDAAPAPREKVSLRGDSGPIWSVAFSPDGKRLASAGGTPDGTGEVKLWDVASGKELIAIRPGAGSVRAVAFAPDGGTLACAGDDGVVRSWDVHSGRQRAAMSGHVGRVGCLAFSPDGKTLAAAGADAVVRLWDAASGKLRAVLRGHAGPVLSVAFAPDARVLATGGNDGVLRLWDVGSGRELRAIHTRAHAVRSVAFAPDGRTLASGGSGHVVRLWELATGREAAVLKRTSPAARDPGVNAIAIAPDGKTLAAGTGSRSDPGEVTLWDVAARKEIASVRGHKLPVRALAFSPDGGTLASGGGDGVVKLWGVGPPD